MNIIPLYINVTCPICRNAGAVADGGGRAEISCQIKWTPSTPSAPPRLSTAAHPPHRNEQDIAAMDSNVTWSWAMSAQL